MLAQIAYEFMPMYREKNIECVTNIEDNLNVSIDVNQFERVFDNLIRNAINYSINDSSINISAKKETNYIIIKLSNTVDLIDKNKLKHIFEPFVRLDKSRNSRTGGAGLGLTITKKIIELHGGTIDVDLDNNLIYFTIKIPM
ncbi:MAG: sensor histidine kinase [Thomasclavelia ramosa]